MSQPVDQDLIAVHNPAPAAFGTILGYAPGNVPVYSSDYATANDKEYPNRHSYRSYIDGIFMGYKWQCVEFVRRWLYLTSGYIFDDVSMAYDIFRLTSVTVISDKSRLPLKSFRNGARRPPEVGCMLIWDEGGEFDATGHVAIVTEVLPYAIRIVEQNTRHLMWPPDRPWSRELKARVAEDGSYWIHCSFSNSTILGWVVQTDNSEYAEDIRPPRRSLFNILMHRAHNAPEHQSWLNIANDDEAAFVQMMGGHFLVACAEDRDKYLVISETARRELKHATNELHAMFMHATDYVLQHPELLRKFNLPEVLWPRIRQSWDNRRNQMISGRFDFCMTEQGIKLYEYNADSSSCHMECGKVQDKWAAHMQVDEGESAGDKLHQELMEAWQRSGIKDVLHIMQDNDLEETYHALFMKEAMERAGLTCKTLRGVQGLQWKSDGAIMDADGVEVRWVWKTWAWETALDQIREECENLEALLKNYQLDQIRAHPPRLVDVLLRKDVMVYEPLWTLIPSNKAIMTVLWDLFPNHPLLLDTRFTLTDELKEKGYAEKPIAGRGGHNISLRNNGGVLVTTDGKFRHQNMIYQELCMLPDIGGYYAQVSTFTVAGAFAAICMRVHKNCVVTQSSDVMPVRVIADDKLLEEEDLIQIRYPREDPS